MNYLPIPLPEAAAEACPDCPRFCTYNFACRRCVARFVAVLPRTTRDTYSRAIATRHGRPAAVEFDKLVASFPNRPKPPRGPRVPPPKWSPTD